MDHCFVLCCKLIFAFLYSFLFYPQKLLTMKKLLIYGMYVDDKQLA